MTWQSYYKLNDPNYWKPLQTENSHRWFQTVEIPESKSPIKKIEHVKNLATELEDEPNQVFEVI